eukprot:598252_1
MDQKQQHTPSNEPRLPPTTYHDLQNMIPHVDDAPLQPIFPDLPLPYGQPQRHVQNGDRANNNYRRLMHHSAQIPFNTPVAGPAHSGYVSPAIVPETPAIGGHTPNYDGALPMYSRNDGATSAQLNSQPMLPIKTKERKERIIKNGIVEIDDVSVAPGTDYKHWVKIARIKLREREVILLQKRQEACNQIINAAIQQFTSHCIQRFQTYNVGIPIYKMERDNLSMYLQYTKHKVT